jgi:hypothetical protein
MKVTKNGWDWLAYCGQHDDSIWCSDWMGAMEAAWGHVVMHHPVVER